MANKKQRRRGSSAAVGLRCAWLALAVAGVAYWAADGPARAGASLTSPRDDANRTARAARTPTAIPSPRDAGPQAKPTFSPTRPGEKAPRAQDTAFEAPEKHYLNLFTKSYAPMRIFGLIRSSEVTRVYRTRHEKNPNDGPIYVLKVQTLRGDRRSKKGTWREGNVYKAASDAGAPIPRFVAWRELERRGETTTYALLTEGQNDYWTLGEPEPFATHARGAKPGAADVAGALAEFHAKGFAHGDAHKENLLWRPATRRIAFVDLENAQRLKRGDAGRSVLELCDNDAADVDAGRGLRMFERTASARCDDARDLNLLLDALHRDKTLYYDYDGALRSKVAGDSAAARREAWRAVLDDAHKAGVALHVHA